MDFALSGEQLLIKESVERFAASRKEGVDAWPEFVRLGWLGIGAPEDLGGFGGPVETTIVMEAFGRSAVVDAFAENAVFPSAIAREAARTDLIEGIVEGNVRAAVAYEEERSGYDPARVTTVAEPAAGGYRISGSKVRVVVPRSAATFIVSALTENGVTLFAVEPGAAGVTRRDFIGDDGSHVATVTFERVAVDKGAVIGDPGSGVALLEAGLDHACGALCAEAVGLGSALLETTVKYSKERTQFGAPIGSFQALQHRMAEMFVEVELARSMTYYAATLLASESDATTRSRGISAAKVQIARSGKFIGESAIQLHGAIAMTDEYKVGRYFKRLTTIARLYGDADYHLARFQRYGRTLTPSGNAARMRSSQTFQSTLERNASA